MSAVTRALTPNQAHKQEYEERVIDMMKDNPLLRFRELDDYERKTVQNLILSGIVRMVKLVRSDGRADYNFRELFSPGLVRGTYVFLEAEKRRTQSEIAKYVILQQNEEVLRGSVSVKRLLKKSGFTQTESVEIVILANCAAKLAERTATLGDTEREAFTNYMLPLFSKSPIIPKAGLTEHQIIQLDGLEKLGIIRKIYVETENHMFRVLLGEFLPGLQEEQIECYALSAHTEEIAFKVIQGILLPTYNTSLKKATHEALFLAGFNETEASEIVKDAKWRKGRIKKEKPSPFLRVI